MGTNVDVERIRSEVKKLISDIIEVPEEELAGDVAFEDLGVDSLMGLEIVAHIEKKYRVQIPEENLQRVRTLNDTLALVNEFVEKRALLTTAEPSKTVASG
jgi:acyl carrier protein